MFLPLQIEGLGLVLPVDALDVEDVG